MFLLSFFLDLYRNRTFPLKTKLYLCECGHGKKKPHLYLVFPHFEKLDSNAGKHKIQKHGDEYNISNGLNSNKHTLDNMLLRQIDDREMLNSASLKPFKERILFKDTFYL